MSASSVSPLAGKPLPKSMLVDVPALLAAYMDVQPDAANPAQRVAFGTSGHRGSSLDGSFNGWHVAAISQAICEYRAQAGIRGPLFMGIDTHALSGPAQETALRVLAANGVQVRIAKDNGFTPTPVISRAILAFNQSRAADDPERADGIVITPSHNPPPDGGFKYNPPHGGPADTDVTNLVEKRANELIAAGMQGLKTIPLEEARQAAGTREHDFIGPYVAELANVIDFDVIRESGLRIGVDPLGGAGAHYWQPIAEHYGIKLHVISTQVDPTFAFMPADRDGKIRMDPSSPWAMQRLIDARHDYDIALACDTDHDRHGIVTPSSGLMPSNHYLAVAIDYLFRHRRQWPSTAAIGKTVVSSALIDRVARELKRSIYEVPVGFKWFVAGLHDGSLAFAGEESAGASFAQHDGTVWTTDKDGITACLLAAEMTARLGHDPGTAYRRLTEVLGAPLTDRLDAPANAAQKKRLAALSAAQVTETELAGDKITRIIDRAPGNDAPIGGIKVETANGWFAARPSGTEDIYKIYVESFRDKAHLKALATEAQHVVDKALQG